MVGPGGDAALLRLAGPGLPASARGVALSTDSNPRGCALDPRAGTALVRGRGRGQPGLRGRHGRRRVVNCLNFGNPEHPEVMWQLSESIDGMAEACRALVASGDRWQRQPLQREWWGRHRPDARRGRAGTGGRAARAAPGLAWEEGDAVVLLGGRAAPDGSFPLEGSRWATERRDHRTGSVPQVDFGAHAAVCGLVAELVAAQLAGGDVHALVHAVHDVSGGGLAVAVAEMVARGRGSGAHSDR